MWLRDKSNASHLINNYAPRLVPTKAEMREPQYKPKLRPQLKTLTIATELYSLSISQPRFYIPQQSRIDLEDAQMQVTQYSTLVQLHRVV